MFDLVLRVQPRQDVQVDSQVVDQACELKLPEPLGLFADEHFGARDFAQLCGVRGQLLRPGALHVVEERGLYALYLLFQLVSPAVGQPRDWVGGLDHAQAAQTGLPVRGYVGLPDSVLLGQRAQVKPAVEASDAADETAVI